MRVQKISILMLTLCLGVTLAHAVKPPTTTIDISSVTNNTWCAEIGQQYNCSTLPFGEQTYDGIPFLIPGNTEGTANNGWFSDEAAGGGSGTVSVTIPVNEAKVKTVYTLMNSLWGSTQSGLLSITFTGSAGATWTFDPIGGTNLRDYNNGSYTDTIACQLPNGVGKSATINAWVNGDGQRLDEQVFELPAAFRTQTLVSITITDNGNSGEQRSFLAAVTVSTALP
ncbi:MAG TPA: hypothetical protein VIH78_02235 [Terriglobales bacterium]